MIDLRSVINSFGQLLTATRRPPGEYNDFGVWEAGVPTQVSLGRASIQPQIDRNVVLPEGVRAEDGLTVYVEGEPKAADDPEGYAADRFPYAGRWYEVQQVRDWVAGGQGMYYKAIAFRVRDDANNAT